MTAAEPEGQQDGGVIEAELNKVRNVGRVATLASVDWVVEASDVAELHARRQHPFDRLYSCVHSCTWQKLEIPHSPFEKTAHSGALHHPKH